MKDTKKIEDGKNVMRYNGEAEETDKLVIERKNSSDGLKDKNQVIIKQEEGDAVTKCILKDKESTENAWKKKGSIEWPMKNIKDPHENDVLFGRGGGTNHHEGNKRYRKMIEKRRLSYVTSKRLDKPQIALEVIREWRGQSPPGRFLKFDEASKTWYDVGDNKAKEKTSQGLREKAPLLRKQQEEEAFESENRILRSANMYKHRMFDFLPYDMRDENFHLQNRSACLHPQSSTCESNRTDNQNGRYNGSIYLNMAGKNGEFPSHCNTSSNDSPSSIHSAPVKSTHSSSIAQHQVGVHILDDLNSSPEKFLIPKCQPFLDGKVFHEQLSPADKFGTNRASVQEKIPLNFRNKIEMGQHFNCIPTDNSLENYYYRQIQWRRSLYHNNFNSYELDVSGDNDRLFDKLLELSAIERLRLRRNGLFAMRFKNWLSGNGEVEQESDTMQTKKDDNFDEKLSSGRSNPSPSTAMDQTCGRKNGTNDSSLMIDNPYLQMPLINDHQQNSSSINQSISHHSNSQSNIEIPQLLSNREEIKASQREISKPQPIKRDTSNQNESPETKHPHKRTLLSRNCLNRGSSIDKVKTFQKLGEDTDNDIRNLSASMQESTLDLKRQIYNINQDIATFHSKNSAAKLQIPIRIDNVTHNEIPKTVKENDCSSDNLSEFTVFQAKNVKPYADKYEKKIENKIFKPIHGYSEFKSIDHKCHFLEKAAQRNDQRNTDSSKKIGDDTGPYANCSETKCQKNEKLKIPSLISADDQTSNAEVSFWGLETFQKAMSARSSPKTLVDDGFQNITSARSSPKCWSEDTFQNIMSARSSPKSLCLSETSLDLEDLAPNVWTEAA
mmetsp:Transcript_18072/g.25530  ORF Transcript_18072/g.25530 Transcript_18072/m.25530 type:complete len:838 (+) Transcript_18072:185-2698(+)